MGRAKPLNGTVGVTKPKAKEVKAALEADDKTKVMAFLDEIITLCEKGEYTVLTAESEE